MELRVRIDDVDAGALSGGAGLAHARAIAVAKRDGEHGVEFAALPGRRFVALRYGSIE